MGKELTAGMGEFVVSHNDDVLVALGLGSCIGVAIYDEEKGIGGLAHVMLPTAKDGSVKPDSPGAYKYADIAIPAMIKELKAKGLKIENMKAKIAGGAHMFATLSLDSTLDIGNKNYEAVIKVLADEKIRLISKDVGGNMGRTVRFDLASRKIFVRTKEGTKEI